MKFLEQFKDTKFYYRLSDDTIIECRGIKEYVDVWLTKGMIVDLFHAAIYLFYFIVFGIIFFIITPLDTMVEIFHFLWGIVKIVYFGLIDFLGAVIEFIGML